MRELWCKISGVTYDKQMPKILKGQLDKTSSSVWIRDMGNQREALEKHLSCWNEMFEGSDGVTLLDHMQNDAIRSETKVCCIREEAQMVWVVLRMDEGNPVKEAFEIRVCEWSMRGWPRKWWLDCAWEEGHKEHVLYCQDWKRVIQWPDPSYLGKKEKKKV